MKIVLKIIRLQDFKAVWLQFMKEIEKNGEVSFFQKMKVEKLFD